MQDDRKDPVCVIKTHMEVNNRVEIRFSLPVWIRISDVFGKPLDHPRGNRIVKKSTIFQDELAVLIKDYFSYELHFVIDALALIKEVCGIRLVLRNRRNHQ